MTAKIPVVEIITKLELGGAQEHVLDLVRGLDRERYVPILVSGTEGELVRDALRLDHVRVHLIPSLVRSIHPLRDLRAFLAIRMILEKIKKDFPGVPIIVQTHSSKAGVLGRWAAHWAGIPFIIHSVHGFGFNKWQPDLVRRAFIRIERLTSAITTRFAVVSRANVDTGLRENIFDGTRAVLIRSGMDLDAFRNAPTENEWLRQDLGLPPGGPVVGTIICFKPQKAPLDFVAMAGRVARLVPEARFLIVGDGELRPRIEAAIRRDGLAGRIVLAGWRRDVSEILKLLDVFVLPSLWEGLPRVLPQAIVSGCPVVATRVDGSPEVVVEGENGYLVEPHDIERMAGHVARILQSPELHSRLSRGFLPEEKEFETATMIRRHEELYRSLINRSSARPSPCISSS